MRTSQNNGQNLAFWGTTPFAASILLHLHEASINLYSSPDEKEGRQEKTRSSATLPPLPHEDQREQTTLSPPPLVVITTPDKKGNRGKKTQSAVAQTARHLSLSVLQPESLDNVFFDYFSQTRCALSIVVAYGKILPARFIKHPACGTINIHTSLLPRYRGASPVQAALLNGDTETGITLMRMDEKMDHGPIIAQKRLALLPDDTPESVFQRMTPLAISLLEHYLPKILAGTAPENPQDHSKASYTKLLTRTNGCIDWTMPALAIERMVRAFTPWPGAYSFLENKRVKILKCGVTKDSHADSSPGTLIEYKQQGQKPNLAVATGGGILVLYTIQQEGKEPQDAQVVYATQPTIIGRVLQSQ
ncbi:MAG: methionyl-tRNA formyltransferase [Candidatus Spechtbacteria bacterium SB0662_bin_43]|uniref:Methionyl-tRNA formyltransferase n=1 Tax=Candidatus Spechtbacteria bacterium SB0662_bin_43 TaxID=2604897 RepID=A0A845D954_9BACT|nr:methionyl-tRNA formyltransferase [Candidatus Spechtbacteria bacterium SB0662_bin_43]